MGIKDIITIKKVEDEDIEFLYEMLKERDSRINVSHKELPTFQQHKKFVKSKPCDGWYIIMAQEKKVGHIQIYNPQGEATAYIGNHKENGGALMFYNRAGNIVSFLGTSLTEVSSEQYGELWIFNASGEGMTYIGTGTANNGVVQTFNQEGNETAYLGTGKNGWGGLILRDDQDEIYFFENGSSRLR